MFAGMLTQGYAQKNKLPQVQQTSIWMEGFEADGKLDEWQQPLQAYNDDTHIAYSLANDDQYLYLAVKSDRTSKIFTGGITLEMVKDDENVAVTYPYNFSYNKRKHRNTGLNPNTPKKISDLTEIEAYGIPDIKTNIIPLLNEYGLQAGLYYVKEGEGDEEEKEVFYTVEIAVPIQYLQITGSKELNYRIRLRGEIPSPDFEGVKKPQGFHFKSDGSMVPFSQALIEKMYQKHLDLYNPTELKGTYRLATKPD
ncbi:hypothetical protein M472_15370 [Sphingobacterium paucimobilis HER1398]|uniref:Uncharacterized protein n=2 Tax=Sphingobacterium TaxID=28453 RepID=U2HX82_9SPHI|nr:hypothetical protein M472_15370 [Sphingobacterium paucimobilis HER1398]